MGEIGLLFAGWDKRTVHTRWDGGGMEVLELAVAGPKAPPFALEVRRLKGSDVLQLAWNICVSALNKS